MLVLAAAILASATPASAFKKCRTADGRLHFTDRPPPGCVVEGEFANPADDSSGDDGAIADEAPAAGSVDGSASEGVDAQAIRTRRRIERDLAAAADDLAALARERESAPKVPAGVYVNTRTGEGSVEDGQTIDPRAEAEIRGREEKVEARIQALRDEFAAVTAALGEAHGGTVPSWWSPAPRCDRCPSP